MKLYTPFGRFCVARRKENRQLLFQMADAIGISAERLSTAEIGESSPEIGWLPSIVEFLNLTELEAKRFEKILKRSAQNLSDRTQYEPYSSAAFSNATPEGREDIR